MDESSESSSEEKSKALERTFVQSINNDSNSMIIGGGDSMTGYLNKVVIVCEAIQRASLVVKFKLNFGSCFRPGISLLDSLVNKNV